MQKQAVSIVVVGEIDHGKSTLIGRLLLETNSLSQSKIDEISSGMDLAFLADQLKEEREQERTIDTTQVFLRAGDRRYCLIDAPGHLEFIKNMMTGATRADAALVVVDALSGLKEQTKRHIALLGLLGIRQAVVVVNKMDLVRYSQKKHLAIKKDAEACLKKAGLVACGSIPVSAKIGDNITVRSKRLRWWAGPSLVKSLEELRVPKIEPKRPLRFPVQDVYRIRGQRIVVGRVEAGSVRKGQSVILMPSATKTKIKAIRSFGKKRSVMIEGENAGLILEGSVTTKRGEVICSLKEPLLRARQFLCYVFWLADKPLRPGERMTLRCATQEVGCFLAPEGRRGLSAPREIEKGRIKTSADILIEPSDATDALGRFVLERAGNVCGVGMILGET